MITHIITICFIVTKIMQERHDNELWKLGYSVHGIDLSAEMIKIAQKNRSDALALTYEVSYAWCFRVESQFDIVISLFHVTSYQNTNEELQSRFYIRMRMLWM